LFHVWQFCAQALLRDLVARREAARERAVGMLRGMGAKRRTFLGACAVLCAMLAIGLGESSIRSPSSVLAALCVVAHAQQGRAPWAPSARRIGLLLALAAAIWFQFVDPTSALARLALALSAALAFYVGSSCLARPDEREWLAWFLDRSAMLLLPIAALYTPSWSIVAVLLTLASAARLHLARPRTQRTLHGAPQPCVRFDCPRCSVRVDFATPISPCPTCGLFVRLGLGAEAEAEAEHEQQTGKAHFACPECGAQQDFPRGRGACAGCGMASWLMWSHLLQDESALRESSDPP